jgi:hypothetical protein
MHINQQPQQEVRNMEERAVVSSMLDLSTLEERCMSEIENDCFRDLANARFSFELLLIGSGRRWPNVNSSNPLSCLLPSNTC